MKGLHDVARSDGPLQLYYVAMERGREKGIREESKAVEKEGYHSMYAHDMCFHVNECPAPN